MKKNRMMRLAAILLVCVLMTTSVISGTFAKYSSEATGTATATVAKWSFKVGTGSNVADIAPVATTTFTFNLFDTINDSGNAAPETDVASGKIAPGTAGSFAIELENTSEVTANYAIDFTSTETNTYNIPIQYTLKTNPEESEWVDDLSSLDVTATRIDKTGTADNKDKATVTVFWRWVYERGSGDDLKTNDATDTALGVAATANNNNTPAVTVTAVITATQVD